MATAYQIKKRAIGGYSVSYDCPRCETALTSPLDEAGTTQPCPNCSQPFVVPGKVERDQLHAKQLQEQRAKAEAKAKEQQERARQKQVADDQTRRDLAALAAHERQQQEYLESHCPYCAEEIRPGVRKCKHCHEYLDAELYARARHIEIKRFRPPFDDVAWFVLKVWVSLVVLSVIGWLLVLLALAILAALGTALRGVP